MIKKLLVLLALISLNACHVKAKKEDLKTENQPNTQLVDQTLNPNPDQNFQTIDNPQQAQAMNQEQQAKDDEIEVQDRIFFDYDSSELSDAAKKILDTQSLWLKSDDSIKITIEGHCDERGTREYNIALGDRRAAAAKNYLVKTGGINSKRIKTVSYGKERPAYFGTDEETISKNRRAVTVVIQ
ncbi:MAG: peptidoglycan-associated lipoprotein Pal [Rickettsiales bacterium]|nr:peptidoglycan-associated lipoprotein Pal [Rickettsiales bacterium]